MEATQRIVILWDLLKVRAFVAEINLVLETT